MDAKKGGRREKGKAKPRRSSPIGQYGLLPGLPLQSRDCTSLSLPSYTTELRTTAPQTSAPAIDCIQHLVKLFFRNKIFAIAHFTWRHCKVSGEI